MDEIRESEILEIFRDDSKLDEYLGNLTSEDLKNLLIYVNSKVRNVPVEENGFCNFTMYVDNLISPNNVIQNRYIGKMAMTLSKVEGRKNKATMMYYLINELHLFEDGNGRTSRAVFEMLTNKDFSFEDNKNLTHNLGEPDGNGVSKIEVYEFARQNNITDVRIIEKVAQYYLYRAMLQKGIVPNSDEYTKKMFIVTDGYKEDIDDGSENIDAKVYIPDEIKQQLSRVQIQELQNALVDNNGGLITTSGLTMLMMFINDNDKLEKFMYQDGKRLHFPVLDDEDNVQTLGDWKKDDFFKAIEIANLLKESMLDIILDFFENPEKFVVDGSLSVRDALTSKSDILEAGNYSTFEQLREHSNLNIDGTRTAKNLEQLSKVLQQTSIQNDNIISTKSVGKQITTEMSNPTLEDAVEQAISKENGIENTFGNDQEELNL